MVGGSQGRQVEEDPYCAAPRGDNEPLQCIGGSGGGGGVRGGSRQDVEGGRSSFLAPRLSACAWRQAGQTFR